MVSRLLRLLHSKLYCMNNYHVKDNNMKTKFTLTKYKEVFPFLGNQWDWFLIPRNETAATALQMVANDYR